MLTSLTFEVYVRLRRIAEDLLLLSLTVATDATLSHFGKDATLDRCFCWRRKFMAAKLSFQQLSTFQERNHATTDVTAD